MGVIPLVQGACHATGPIMDEYSSAAQAAYGDKHRAIYESSYVVYCRPDRIPAK